MANAEGASQGSTVSCSIIGKGIIPSGSQHILDASNQDFSERVYPSFFVPFRPDRKKALVHNNH
jgi:hypothetical protein